MQTAEQPAAHEAATTEQEVAQQDAIQPIEQQDATEQPQTQAESGNATDAASLLPLQGTYKLTSLHCLCFGMAC
jgi:hypothetical protein